MAADAAGDRNIWALFGNAPFSARKSQNLLMVLALSASRLSVASFNVLPWMTFQPEYCHQSVTPASNNAHMNE
jgi:hypothetical protein